MNNVLCCWFELKPSNEINVQNLSFIFFYYIIGVQLINLFSNDSQRIYEFATMGPMIIGGVIVAIIGTIYIIYMLGPHALLGMTIFVLSYPLQYAVSSANGIHFFSISFKIQKAVQKIFWHFSKFR